jgi:hypothetical protein
VEEDFVYELALAVHQRHRFHRHEHSVTLEGIKVDIFSEQDKRECEREINFILEGDEEKLLEEIADFERLIDFLQKLDSEPDQTPMESAEAECLVRWLFGANGGQEDEGEQNDSPIADPPPEGWTYCSVRQVVIELSEALSKSPEAVISDAIAQAKDKVSDKRQRLETAWLYVQKGSLPEAEPMALIDLYDRRSLNRITKLLNVLDRLQSVRLGRPTLPVIAVDHTVTFDGNGDSSCVDLEENSSRTAG